MWHLANVAHDPCDPWTTWSMIHVTYDLHDPWPTWPIIQPRDLWHMWPLANVTHDPCDPWTTWPLTHMTHDLRDPWPTWPLTHMTHDVRDPWPTRPTWSMTHVTPDPHDPRPTWPMTHVTHDYDPHDPCGLTVIIIIIIIISQVSADPWSAWCRQRPGFFRDAAVPSCASPPRASELPVSCSTKLIRCHNWKLMQIHSGSSGAETGFQARPRLTISRNSPMCRLVRRHPLDAWVQHVRQPRLNIC